MRKLTFGLILILLTSLVYAQRFDWIYNPYTSKLDRSLALNQSGYSFTANHYYLADGSEVGTGGSGIDSYWNNTGESDILGNYTGNYLLNGLGISTNNDNELNISVGCLGSDCEIAQQWQINNNVNFTNNLTVGRFTFYDDGTYLIIG